MTYKKCSVNGCNSKSTSTKCSFFRIPFHSEKRCTEWFASVDLSGAKAPKFVCEFHFDKEDFIKGRLKLKSIPRMVHSTNGQLISQTRKEKKEKPNLKTRKCILQDCRNFKFLNKNMRFCIFPSNPDIRDKWLQFCGFENVPKYSYLCREHFDVECFSGRKIKYNSVPTILPEPNTNVIIEESDMHKVNDIC